MRWFLVVVMGVAVALDAVGLYGFHFWWVWAGLGFVLGAAAAVLLLVRHGPMR